MPILIFFILFVLIVLCIVLLARTALISSKNPPIEPTSFHPVDNQGSAGHLSRAVQFQTVSCDDPELEDRSEFLKLHDYLEQTFPFVHSQLVIERAGGASLLYTWQGFNPALKPVIMMGHIDVVPVEAGTQGKWKYPPFEGSIAEGYLWGRGTMDDKGSVLGILEAAEMLLKAGFQPQRTVYLAFGEDEEVSGKRGATQIVRLLQSRGVQAEFVLDEGMTVLEHIVPFVSKPVALVGVAEKGYLSVDLSAEVEGGHASMPSQSTAIGVLSAAVHRLERHPFPARLTPQTRQMFASLAPGMPFTIRLVFANLWLFGALVKRLLASSAATNATLRTTTAVTIFEGGVKDNILPSRARAVVNFRILPGETFEDVLAHIRKVVNNPVVQIHPLTAMQSQPSNVSDAASPSFRTLARVIRTVFPGAIVAPGLVLGATDCRLYAGLSQNLFRFSPLRVSPEDIDRPHGANERISLENYTQVIQFYMELIRRSTHDDSQA